MRAFETLGSRGQIGRLRRLAETALAAYDIQPVRLVSLAHLENTIFRVETVNGERYVLRIHRTTGSPFHPPRSVAEVQSETAWLAALRRDAALTVPEPIPTSAGSVLTIARTDGIPDSRVCVLFRWEHGRFYEAGLTPSHLELVGRFVAQMHEHARSFRPPPEFIRWRVADLVGDLATTAVGVIGDVRGSAAGRLVETILGQAQQARRELGEGPEVFGLIHADFHQENYLFDRGQVRAIDFDDCGWGYYVYDLSVVLSELRERSDYGDLRAGLLRGYRAVRPLPVDNERYLDVFHGLRVLLLILWFIEQRDHPLFADWEEHVDEGLANLATLMEHLTSPPS